MDLKTLAELGRVSNLPTCVSNVTAAYVLGGGDPLTRPWPYVATLAATILFYESGMVLNDVCDAEIDRVERPERPIPSGRISRRAAAVLAGALALAGLAVVAWQTPAALPIALTLFALIAFYDFTHKSFAGAPIAMGACRGAVYLLAAKCADTSNTNAWPFALNLAFYVAAVSFVARFEMQKGINWSQQTALRLGTIAVGAPIFYAAAKPSPLVALAVAAALAWTMLTRYKLMMRKIPTPAAVGRMLAGMSLFDAVTLAVVGSPVGAAVAWACFGATVLGHRKVKGS